RTRRNTSRQQFSHFFEQTSVQHPLTTLIDAPVQLFSRRIQPYEMQVKTGKRLTRLLLQMLGKRLPSLQAHFQSTDNLRFIAYCDADPRSRIEPAQQTMNVRAALALGQHFQSVSPICGTAGAIEQPFGERTQVQTGATDEDRQFMPLPDFFQYAARIALIITGRI